MVVTSGKKGENTMTQRKDTAHRPSQSGQEYVLRADGTKVRNTAYVPNTQDQRTLQGGLQDVKEGIAPQGQNPRNTYLDQFTGDLEDYADSHAQNIKNIAGASLQENGGNITYDDFTAMRSLTESLYGSSFGATKDQAEVLERLEDHNVVVSEVHRSGAFGEYYEIKFDDETLDSMVFRAGVDYDGKEYEEVIVNHNSPNDVEVQTKYRYADGKPYKTLQEFTSYDKTTRNTIEDGEVTGILTTYNFPFKNTNLYMYDMRRVKDDPDGVVSTEYRSYKSGDETLTKNYNNGDFTVEMYNDSSEVDDSTTLVAQNITPGSTMKMQLVDPSLHASWPQDASGNKADIQLDEVVSVSDIPNLGAGGSHTYYSYNRNKGVVEASWLDPADATEKHTVSYSFQKREGSNGETKNVLAPDNHYIDGDLVERLN